MLLSILPLFLPFVSAAVVEKRLLTSSQVCSAIASQINGAVYYPTSLTTNYQSDISHYMSSSSQTPACVVEVANPRDISIVLKIVGATRTPFAVKSGGHASNPGFSSTTGVHISLVRLKQVILSTDKKTAEVGLGNAWTDVYSALNGTGVNIVGGRVPGPGTGGFSLGGGYSWLTNQYGLTCDNVKSFNLILPNGTITTVDSSKSDLFFALKGGLNRFGIVSSIIFKTVPQPDLIYGGSRIYTFDKIAALSAATADFQNTNTDPKAQVILTLNNGLVGQLVQAILIMFYDGPTNPAVFAGFDAILPLTDGVKTQTYVDFINSTPSNLQSGSRGAFHSLSTTGLTERFVKAAANESAFYAAATFLRSGTFYSYDVEPFGKYGQYATDSAFPHDKSQLPLNLYFSWVSPTDDAFLRGYMQTSVDYLKKIAIAEGIYSDSVPTYANYALSTYSGPQLFGATNAARLRRIQSKYDPNGVMKQLTGGFSF